MNLFTFREISNYLVDFAALVVVDDEAHVSSCVLLAVLEASIERHIDMTFSQRNVSLTVLGNQFKEERSYYHPSLRRDG